MDSSILIEFCLIVSILFLVIFGNMYYSYITKKRKKNNQELENFKKVVSRNKLKDDKTESIDVMVQSIKKNNIDS